MYGASHIIETWFLVRWGPLVLRTPIARLGNRRKAAEARPGGNMVDRRRPKSGGLANLFPSCVPESSLVYEFFFRGKRRGGLVGFGKSLSGRGGTGVSEADGFSSWEAGSSCPGFSQDEAMKEG